MVDIVFFDPDVHLDDFRQMYIEWLSGQMDELKEIYGVNFFSISGRKVEEIVEANLDRYSGLKPPKGTLLILEVEGAVAGMVALMKLSESRGFVNLMYNRIEFRGKGYAKQLFIRLLEEGRKIGVTCFQLRTPVFSAAAHHIYRSAGFKEVEEYPESLMPIQPSQLQPYSIYMEKKEL
jgi:GNAT superfamily N-acetyltransferase